MLDVCLLGTGGMMPLPNRWLTAALFRYNGSNLLIDCGEGTQITMRLLGWSFKSIDYICFTHFHGDHIGGLPGLLLTIGNSDRTEPITLIGPRGLKRIVEGLLLIAPELPFKIKYIELDARKVSKLQLGEYYLTSYGVEHGMPCLGYTLDIKRLPKFLPEKAKELNVPINLWNKLQKGQKVEFDGNIVEPDMVLGSKRKGLRVSYCTDTRPVKSIIDNVKDADLFICEGMYGDDEKDAKAKDYKHMTFKEAANLAKSANVNELWLTHYSPSMVNPKEYKDSVRKVFKKTVLGKDRMTKTLTFSNNS